MRVPRCLGVFPYRRVRLVCPWCPGRRGDYCVERLTARLGPRATPEDVLVALVRCRWPKPWHVRRPAKYTPWCRARFAELGGKRPPDRPGLPLTVPDDPA